ncbi:delta(3,5)-Delta(2,4)-dienoyl-CoA isomerase [Pseudohyphozyma bogoriensis]|nr:delta(3,5)-Delta(2,4)-dienoyl-CoA isomerase [Pseudohyphozyma bogoriensis]
MSPSTTTYPNQHILTSFPSPHVLLLSLHRTPVNAFNDALWTELGQCADVASEDDAVRVVVLASGIDKVWTAGLDLRESSLTSMEGSDPSRTALLLRAHIHHLQTCVSALESCTKPVIAAINGIAYGAGVDISAACDIRICSDDVRFAIKEVDVGLAADVGSLQRVPRSTGASSLLRELAFTARDFGHEEATKLGFVSKVVSGGREGVLEEAMKMAKVIAGAFLRLWSKGIRRADVVFVRSLGFGGNIEKSPIAVLGTKHLLNYSRDHTVAEGLNYTATWNMAMLQSEDLTEAFKAFATKKKPAFKKLGKL